MNKKDLIYSFIKNIERNRLLTVFISNMFNYENLTNYNYLFRLTKTNSEVIMDIYDNISINRFNRYIFVFDSEKEYVNKLFDGVYLTYINVKTVKNSNNKLNKLAYLLKLSKYEAIEYAKTFLDKRIVNILIKTIKKAN